MNYQTYNMEDVFERAILRPGYYWINSWRGRNNVIVSVYHGKTGRMVTDGCEYSEWKLSELIEEYPQTKFCGPIVPPENFN